MSVIEKPILEPDHYLLGSYRIATTPEPYSGRLTSFKSTYFDSPANKVGPWPTSLRCTTNSYSSIKPSSALHASHEQPATRLPLQPLNGLTKIPGASSAFQSTRSSVRDTTYFFAASQPDGWNSVFDWLDNYASHGPLHSLVCATQVSTTDDDWTQHLTTSRRTRNNC